eukprot:SAG31_NODE_31782_length_364_cov_0.784906_1_plen_56_part_01
MLDYYIGLGVVNLHSLCLLFIVWSYSLPGSCAFRATTPLVQCKLGHIYRDLLHDPE